MSDLPVSPDITRYVPLALFGRTSTDIALAALQDLASNKLPGVTLREAMTEVLLIETLAVEVGDLGLAVDSIPSTVYEVLLRQFDVDRDAGAAAATTLEFTLIDTAGHTVPAGTEVAVDVLDGVVVFTTDEDLIVAAASSVGTVAATAVTIGDDANGITAGTVVRLRSALGFVQAVEIASDISGGRDPETDDEYFTRAAQRLSRLTEVLVLPSHFTAMALEDANVYRATTVDLYDPGQGNEKQTVTITGSPTGGTFTLTFTGQTTATIARTATAADVQTALEALSNINVGDVAVTGGPLPAAVTVQFMGQYAGQNVAQMTKAHTFTGGTSPDVAIATTQVGGAEVAGDHTGHVTVGVRGSAGSLTSGQKADLEATLEAAAVANLDVHIVDAVITTVPVTVSVKAAAGYASSTVQDAVEAALDAYLDPAAWPWAAKVRRNELISLIDQVAGVDYVDTLTAPASDVTLVGEAPLVDAGTLTVSVT